MYVREAVLLPFLAALPAAVAPLPQAAQDTPKFAASHTFWGASGTVLVHKHCTVQPSPLSPSSSAAATWGASG